MSEKKDTDSAENKKEKRAYYIPVPPEMEEVLIRYVEKEGRKRGILDKTQLARWILGSFVDDYLKQEAREREAEFILRKRKLAIQNNSSSSSGSENSSDSDSNNIIVASNNNNNHNNHNDNSETKKKNNHDNIIYYLQNREQ